MGRSAIDRITGEIHILAKLALLVLLVAVMVWAFESMTPTAPAAPSAQVTAPASSALGIGPKALTHTAIGALRLLTETAAPWMPPPESLVTWTTGPTWTAYYGDTEHRIAGDGEIFESSSGPLRPGYSAINQWHPNYDDELVVYGGCEDFGAPAPVGEVVVVDWPVGGQGRDTAKYATPIDDGCLRIVDAVGRTLYLRSWFNNLLWSFDVEARVVRSPADISPPTAPAAPIPVGASFSVSATFRDAITTDTHTASVDWGDGTASPGSVEETGGAGTVSASHTYNVAGVFALSLTVTDSEGTPYTVTRRFLVAYDPQGGFVTAGGWLDSPPGSVPSQPEATGKADVGSEVRYPRSGSAPRGSVRFSLKDAAIELRSTSLDWLMVSGPKAHVRGLGEFADDTVCAFLATLWDGARAPGGGVDKIRLRLWDPATGKLLYDNQPGAADTADPTMPLGGGSIVIHD